MKKKNNQEAASQAQVSQSLFPMKKICKRRFRIARESLKKQRIKKIKACNWELDRPDTIINDEALKLLSKAMKSAKTARRLNLRRELPDDITDLGLYHFSHSLKNLTTIQHLTLSCYSWDKTTDEGLYYLCKGLKRLRFLECAQANVGFYLFGEALKRLTSLRTLCLNLDFVLGRRGLGSFRMLAQEVNIKKFLKENVPG